MDPLAALVIAVVSLALVVGAAWGVYGRLPGRLEGFIVALAGGALIVSAVLELIDPSTETSPIWVVGLSVLAGAGAFVGLDVLIERRMGSDSGGGLLAAITLDGIPENLALGVALIGAGPLQVAALSSSILLSNLPEAAGGARAMRRGRSNARVMGVWIATAVLLSLAAVAGNLLLEGVPEPVLGPIRCLAAGAVLASLADEVFPQAFDQDHYVAGLATALGVVVAVALNALG